MGQAVSKAASRIVSSGATKSTHIPSVPGKSGPVGTVAPDPFSGFTRGGGAGHVGTQREEAQRQFLQSQQSDSSSVYSDKLPDDLIKFMTDVGPLKTNKDETATGVKRPRIPRVSGSLFAPKLDDIADSDRGAADSLPKSQSPAYDKTRRTESMRLAENVAGIETTRTTSFSYKQDEVNPNESTGLDVVQLYSFLTKASTTDSFCPKDANNSDEQRALLEQSMKFLQVPVLLKDSDGSYVGAWPEKAEALQKAHRMELVPKHRAKLVLEDLWEIEQSTELETVPASKTVAS